MGEINEAKKDAALNDQSSTGVKESTSKTPQELTPDIKKAVSDALAEQGRKHKVELTPIVQERETFRVQAEQATASLQETKTRIADLEADLEEAIGKDEDLLDIKRVKAELRAERDRARQEVRVERDAVAELRRTVEAERLEWAGTVAEAQAFKFDGELARVVDEYNGDVTANFNKLKTACDKAGIKTIEGAEAIAELSFTKKGEEPELLVDSGVTTEGVGTGRKPTLEELKAATPAEFEQNVKSGKWKV